MYMATLAEVFSFTLVGISDYPLHIKQNQYEYVSLDKIQVFGIPGNFQGSLPIIHITFLHGGELKC
jgi:hypothetical protein